MADKINKRAYYKDIKTIKFCKVCGVPFRPKRGSVGWISGLCHKHRYLYSKKLAEYSAAWWGRKTPEYKREYKKKNYESWKKWVEKNKKKRRLIALKSYHRRKNDPKNKARKHVSTRLRDS
jgi:hypothetical protein